MGRTLSGISLGVGFIVALLMLPVQPARAGGAIAVGPCAAYGYSYDFRDLAQAQTAALAKCSDKTCRIVVTLTHACGAFAIDGTNACGAYGYAVAPGLSEAQNKALRECHKFGGHECVIRTWACDSKG